MNKLFKNRHIKFLFFTLLIFQISNVTSLPTGYIMFFIFTILFIHGLLNDIYPTGKIISISIIWIIINVLSAFIFDREFKSSMFLFSINLILLPYYIYKIYKFDFWVYFEKYIFILTALSLPLFLLNVVFFDQFNSLATYFKPFTNSVFDHTPTYWSAIGFYTNSLSTYGLFRNCGFMWEPGYFAVIIIIAMIVNWLIYGINLNKKTILYTIALVTTFSTSGYIALFFLYLAFFIKRLKWYYIVPVVSLFIIFSINIFVSNEFMSGKIDVYLETVEEDRFVYSEVYKSVKLNRIQIFLFDIERVLRYPLGFGNNDRINFDDVNVTGTNGIAGMLRMWGIPMFILWLYLLYKFFLILNFKNLDKKIFWLLMLAFLCMYFSQNIHRNVILYYMLIFPLIFKPKLLWLEKKKR